MERVPLRELCRIVGGKPNPTEDAAFDEEGLPFVKMKDLGKYHQTSNLTKVSSYINEDYAAKNGYKAIKKGAILIPRSGSVALNHRAILGIDAAIVSHICALEILDSQVIDNKYLYYYLTMLDMGRIAQKTTGLDSITFSRLGKVKIPIVPLIEQIKIVAYLDKINELTHKRDKSIRLLDEYIRSLFFEMFGDPVINSKNWPKTELKKLGKIITGNTPPKKNKEYYSEGSEEIDWIKSDNIDLQKYYCTGAAERLSKKGASVGRVVPRESTLIISITGSKKRLGDCAMAFDEVAFNQQINAFVPEGNKVYYYFLLKFSKPLIQRLSNSALKQLVTKTALENLPVINPNKKMQSQFENKFRKVSIIKDLFTKSYEHLNILFKASNQSAFSEETQINEEEVFESLLKEFTTEDLKKGNRLQYLLNWLNYEDPKFSHRDHYNNAWDKLRELLEDGILEQVLEKDKIKLNVVR